MLKKWFNIECQHARNHFHVQKRNLSKSKTFQNKTNMTAANKAYKVIRRSVNAFKHNFKKYMYIRNMRSKSPKMYWHYISSIGKPKRHVDLDNNLFYNFFFKDLNAHVNDDDETVPDVSFPDINLQHNLDVDITADEITKCIKILSCGKASDPDSVLNEYKYLTL